MSTGILNDFNKRLRDYLVSSWKGGLNAGPNILAINTHPKATLLYVKVRSEPPGFWGLTANRINELNSSGNNWFAVLLLSSAKTGYLLPAKEVTKYIKAGDWTLSKTETIRSTNQQILRLNMPSSHLKN